MKQRQPPYRSRALLDLSRDEDCVRCGCMFGTVVPAHYSGPRRDLCSECHSYMDTLSRDKEGRWGHSEEFLNYVILTLAKRFVRGQIRIARKNEALPEVEVTRP